jgi:ABC-type hemin transport system ATPase subunit
MIPVPAYADRVVFLRDGKIATQKEIDTEASVQENLKSIMAEIENLEA